jgi:hypothetical protein
VGIEVNLHSFLTWGLHGSGKHLIPVALALRKKHGTHFKRGWKDVGAGMGILEDKPPLPAFEVWLVQPML